MGAWVWRRRGLLPIDSLRRRGAGTGGGGAGAGLARVNEFPGRDTELGVEVELVVEHEEGGWLELRAKLQWAKLGSELHRWREKGTRTVPESWPVGGGEKEEEISRLHQLQTPTSLVFLLYTCLPRKAESNLDQWNHVKYVISLGKKRNKCVSIHYCYANIRIWFVEISSWWSQLSR